MGTKKGYSVAGWTPEARAKKGEQCRKQWRENRHDFLFKRNARTQTETPSSVRTLRLLLNMSQPQFAVAVGLSAKTCALVSQWELGRRVPENRIAKMYELAQSHGLKDWQFTG